MSSPSSVRTEISVTPRPQPFLVCAAPEMTAVVRQLHSEGLLAGAQILTFEGSRPPLMHGPGIVLLGPADLRGPLREKLLDLTHSARPGRPVLYGGTSNRDVLLDAINTWRVFRVVPESPRLFLLGDAIRKAQEALELECGLEQAAGELRSDTQRLEQALDELKTSQERTRHAERLSTLGRITKSLVPVIAEHLDALSEFSALVASGGGHRDTRLDELIGYAFTGIRSLHAMLDEIRGYAENRPESYELQPVDLDEVIRLATAFCRYDPLSSQRRLTTDLRSRAQVKADTFRLHQTLVNLVRNAFQAAPEGTEVTVRTFNEPPQAGRLAVCIDVENAGAPIPAEVQSRLFQPFFTTKGEEGMGLGLSLCRATVEAHGGVISCTSRPGERTRFRVRLPRFSPG